jgi:hypothetical protein
MFCVLVELKNSLVRCERGSHEFSARSGPLMCLKRRQARKYDIVYILSKRRIEYPEKRCSISFLLEGCASGRCVIFRYGVETRQRGIS